MRRFTSAVPGSSLAGRLALVSLFAVLAPLPAHAQQRPAAPARRASAEIDWDRLRDETVRVLSEYMRVNTANPPGNEIEGARYLQRILEREGIEARILDTTEMAGRRGANLYARLKGTGSRKALALVHHIDVVPADPRYWTVDAYSGAIKDGYIYGRGAVDMKSYGIVQLMTMIAIKRSGMPLSRDLVYIANADEEAGGIGAEIFVQRHSDLLKDVEYLLTEGGGGTIRDGKVRYGVGVAEKRALWQQVVVRGVSGHGSRPTKGNPVPRLIAALDRIARWETPLHVMPSVERVLRADADNYTGEQRAWLLDVRKSLADPRAREWILSDLTRNAILRNTISITMLQGSQKTNIIPPEATASIDIRLLPDQDPHAFMAELVRVAADTAVHFSGVPAQMKPPLEVPIDTDLFRAIERAARERDPGAVVAPSVSTGGTDRPTYRALGIVTYGFAPFRTLEQDGGRAHGNDERISVENVGFGLRMLYDIVRYVQTDARLVP